MVTSDEADCVFCMASMCQKQVDGSPWILGDGWDGMMASMGGGLRTSIKGKGPPSFAADGTWNRK